jgi:hypothetical protein
MKNHPTDFVVIFRTGRLFELDMATEILEKNNIPYYRQEETSSGLRLAMPFQPTPGPGVWFSILVPKSAVNKANKILSELPFKIEIYLDIWHFSSSKESKSVFRSYSWLWILVFLFWAIFIIIRFFL